jgi:two-component system response regulator
MEPNVQNGQGRPMTGSADVLLVEDDNNDAELTVRALTQCGIGLRVEHVQDGAEALEYIASTNLFVDKHAVSVPKLILLDLKLNRIGGLHVLRRLKSDDRTKGIPIVVLTASKLAIEVAESYKLGVNSYVIKPADAAKFAEVVAAIGRYWLAINEAPQ